MELVGGEGSKDSGLGEHNPDEGHETWHTLTGEQMLEIMRWSGQLVRRWRAFCTTLKSLNCIMRFEQNFRHKMKW